MKNNYNMDEEKLARIVLEMAFKVHTALGPGLLESAYKECLYHSLQNKGLSVSKEVPMPLVYDGLALDYGYRIDLLVENKLVLEIKSVEQINEVHLAQTLTYMRLGKFHLGFLLNFNVPKMRNGVRRVINGYTPL
jgi:GxxExxY protein